MGYYPGRKEAAVTGQGEWGGGVEGRVGWLGWNLLFFLNELYGTVFGLQKNYNNSTEFP